MNNRTKKLSVIIRTFGLIFLLAFTTIYKIFPDEKNYFNTVLSADAADESILLTNSSLTEDKKADLYRISPFMSMKEGSYNLVLDCTADEDLMLKACLISEYDTETGNYPVIDIGVIRKGSTVHTFTAHIPQTARQLVFAVDYQGQGIVSLNSCEITSTEPVYSNSFVYAVVIAAISALFAAVISMIMLSDCKEKYSRLFTVVFVMFIAVVASAGLLKWDVILADDYEFHLLRITGIAQNIMSGRPFSKVNFAFNGGYGYLNPVFYPQLFLLVPALFMVMGASVTKAYVLFVFVLNITTAAVAQYCFGRITEKRWYGLICTAVYTLNHYRMRDIYARAAVGELLFIAFLPLVFYGIYAIFHNDEKKWYILMIGCCAVFQSHILGTVLTAIAGALVIAIYMAVHLVTGRKVSQQFGALVKAGAGTVLFNLWFLIPVLYYIRQSFGMFTHTDYVQLFIDTAAPVKNMLFSSANVSYGERYARMGTFTGVIFVAAAVIAVFRTIKQKKPDESLIYFLLAVLFMIASSNIMPWDKLRTVGVLKMLMSKLQFAFRFVTLFIVCLTMTVAVHLREYRSKSSVFLAIALAVITLCGAQYYTLPVNAIDGHNGDYNIFDTSPPEYFMQGAAYHEERARRDKFRTDSSDITFTAYSRIGGGIAVDIENTSSDIAHIEVPLMYYVGYKAVCETTGRQLPVAPGEHMVVSVEIPPAVSGRITVTYHQPWFFIAAQAVSGITRMLCIAVICIKYTKKHKNMAYL